MATTGALKQIVQTAVLASYYTGLYTTPSQTSCLLLSIIVANIAPAATTLYIAPTLSGSSVSDTFTIVSNVTIPAYSVWSWTANGDGLFLMAPLSVLYARGALSNYLCMSVLGKEIS